MAGVSPRIADRAATLALNSRSVAFTLEELEHQEVSTITDFAKQRPPSISVRSMS